MNTSGTHLQTQKPNTTYTVMLCIFFCFLFRLSIGAISQFSNWLVQEIKLSDSPVFNSLYYLDYFLWFVFGFWSIMLALKGSKHAIPCLKLCLPFHFIALLISGLSHVSFIHLSSTWFSLLIVLFPLIFFIYLCSSKEINQAYPKSERSLGLPGLIGIALYALLALLSIQMIIAGVSKRQNSKKIDPAKIELHEGELTDGRAIFKPNETWILDSCIILNPVQDAFYFHDTVWPSTICIVCATEEYEPLRYNYIYSISENQPDELRRFYKDDIGFKEIDNDENVIFVDQYFYQADSTSYYWTYASKLGKKLEKGIRLSIIEKDSLRTTIDDAIEFLESSSLNIKDRLLKKD